MKSIDGLIRYRQVTVALQVKKETYRPEAREGRRFARRYKHAHWMVEVPYTIAAPEEIRRSMERAKIPETKAWHALRLFLAETLQRRLPNGFVVFRPHYPRPGGAVNSEAD